MARYRIELEFEEISDGAATQQTEAVIQILNRASREIGLVPSETTILSKDLGHHDRQGWRQIKKW